MITKIINLLIAVILTFLPVSTPCIMSSSIICSCHSFANEKIDSADCVVDKPQKHSCCGNHTALVDERNKGSDDQPNNPQRCPNCDHEILKSLKSLAPDGFQEISSFYFAVDCILSSKPCLPFYSKIDVDFFAKRPPNMFERPPPISVVVVKTHRLLI